jgi:rhodanese-related sulfurtransferase
MDSMAAPRIIRCSLAALCFWVSACSALPEREAPLSSMTLASDVTQELAQGAILVDVRGPTERAREGVPKQAHHVVVFGPDHWRGPPGEAETALFLTRVSEAVGPPGPRLILLCSVGVRSAAASTALTAAGYEAENIMDGWRGNDMGLGLRALEP